MPRPRFPEGGVFDFDFNLQQFNVLRSRSNTNKKVISTQYTCVLFSHVFANQNPRPPLAILLGSADQYLRRPSRPHRFPLLLFDFPVLPKPFRPLPLRAHKSRRINTYKSLSKQRTLTIFRMIDLQKAGGEGGVMVNQKSGKDFYPACPELRREREQRVEGSTHYPPTTTHFMFMAPLAPPAPKDGPCREK